MDTRKAAAAVAFYELSKGAFEKAECGMERKEKNPDVEYGMLYIAGMVNAAFSCELFLKSMCNDTTKHKLKELFDLLEEEEKDVVRYAVTARLKKNNPQYNESTFDVDLKNISNTFVEWRYYYENGFQYDYTNVYFLRALADFFYCYYKEGMRIANIDEKAEE